MASETIDNFLIDLTCDYGVQVAAPRLLNHQRAAVREAATKRSFLFADDTGLGKSAEAIASMQSSPAWQRVKNGVVIVAAPGTLLQHKWVSELRAMGEEGMVAAAGSSAGEQVRAAVGAGMRWLVMGYDAAAKSGGLHRRLLLSALAQDQRLVGIIMDECHYVKNYKAARTEAWLALINQMRAGHEDARVYGLSATPLARSPEDILSIFSLLGRVSRYYPARLFGLIWEEVRVSRRRKVRKVVGWRGEAGKRVLAGHSIQRLKADILTDLAPLREAQVPVPVDEEAFERGLAALLGYWAMQRGEQKGTDAKKPVATTERMSSLLMALGQPDEGFTNNQLETLQASLQVTGELKAPFLAEYLANSLSGPEEQLIVFAKHRAVAALIGGELMERAVETRFISGEHSADVREQNIAAFRAGKAQVLILTYGVGAVGIDLTEAQRVVLAELDWSPVSAEQAKNRIHRIGQSGQTLCETMLASGGNAERIEQLVINIQRTKKAHARRAGLAL